MLQILYSVKFSLVHNFAEIIHPESSEEILAVFIFNEFVMMPPLPVDGHAPHTH